MEESVQRNDSPARAPSPLTPVACRYCGRPVIWAKTEKSFGPFDPKPHLDGTFELRIVQEERVPRAIYVGRYASNLAYTSHFATCPKADHARQAAKDKRR